MLVYNREEKKKKNLTQNRWRQILRESQKQHIRTTFHPETRVRKRWAWNVGELVGSVRNVPWRRKATLALCWVQMERTGPSSLPGLLPTTHPGLTCGLRMLKVQPVCFLSKALDTLRYRMSEAAVVGKRHQLLSTLNLNIRWDWVTPMESLHHIRTILLDPSTIRVQREKIQCVLFWIG